MIWSFPAMNKVPPSGLMVIVESVPASPGNVVPVPISATDKKVRQPALFPFDVYW